MSASARMSVGAASEGGLVRGGGWTLPPPGYARGLAGQAKGPLGGAVPIRRRRAAPGGGSSPGHRIRGHSRCRIAPPSPNPQGKSPSAPCPLPYPDRFYEAVKFVAGQPGACDGPVTPRAAAGGGTQVPGQAPPPPPAWGVMQAQSVPGRPTAAPAVLAPLHQRHRPAQGSSSNPRAAAPATQAGPGQLQQSLRRCTSDTPHYKP